MISLRLLGQRLSTEVQMHQVQALVQHRLHGKDKDKRYHHQEPPRLRRTILGEVAAVVAAGAPTKVSMGVVTPTPGAQIHSQWPGSQ